MDEAKLKILQEVEEWRIKLIENERKMNDLKKDLESGEVESVESV